MTAPIPVRPGTADQLARACYSLAGWRDVWQTAAENGHLTDELKAQLTPIGEALAKAQQDQAAAAGPVGDPDDLWMQIVAKCPEDWTTPYLEQDFAQWAEGVIPADADVGMLAGYLAELKAGRR